MSKTDWITPQHVIEARREVASKSLVDFVKMAWKVLEPGQPYAHGRHIDVMAEHLEAVERGDITRLLLNVPPGSMKPVAVSEPVVTRRGVVPLGEVCVGDYVLTHKGRFRRVEAVHEQGVIPVVRVNTHAGRSVVAAPDHPFLTTHGWVNAGDLRAGDYVGFPHRREDFEPAKITPEEARLMGYLVGDGCLTHAPSFVNMDRETLDDFVSCASSVGWIATERKHANPNVKASRVGIKGARAWLEAHGLMGVSSYTKRIPVAVMQGDEEVMRNFLGAYWSCDGTVSIRHSGKKTCMKAGATTVGEGLSRDLLHLMAAINIDARVRARAVKLETKRQPGGVYRSFELVTSERNEVAKFQGLPGLVSRKEALTRKAFRDRFDPDIYADEVVGVEQAGEAECRCLTVEEDHSFVAGGLIVHNSMLCGVFYPAWVWGPKGKPSHRFIGIAHEQSLGVRDNLKCRRLIESPWYQNTWGKEVSLVKDQNEKLNFENTAKGWRAVATPSNVTGRRGDAVLCDDLLSAENANSEAEREKVNLWYRESLPTRLNNPDSSSIINVMQRLHERDVSGLILAEKLGYEHVMIPMRFEPERQTYTSLGRVDWRTEPGELMFPERFPEHVVDELERVMGAYASASQLQQRPAPRDGGLFKQSWFQPIDARPNDIIRTVRAWDLAATKKQATNNPDWTAGVRMSRTASGLFIIEGVNRFRGSAAEVEAAIKTTATADGKDVTIRIPQDPGQAGKGQAEQMIRMLAGYSVRAERPTGDKATRAAPAAAQAEVGNVRILRTGDKDRDAWIQPFLDEIALFPAGAHDDQIDAMADALNELALGGAGYGVENLKAWG